MVSREQLLLKALLNPKIYQNVPNSLTTLKLILPRDIHPLLETVVHIQSITTSQPTDGAVPLGELRAAHLARNPNLTGAAIYNLDEILNDLEKIEPPNEENLKDIFQRLAKQETARKIAELALDISGGRSEHTFDEITAIMENRYEFDKPQVPTPVDNTLDAIINKANLSQDWTFNLRSLREKVKGVGPGLLVVLAARPEVGKTATWVSFCAAPDGFLAQGLTVNAYLNEEQTERVMMRMVSSWTGLVADKILSNREEANGIWEKIRKQTRFYDASTLSLRDIEASIKEDKPNITVIDQLDKVKIDGTFTRGDEELREKYKRTRDIAKSLNTCIFAVSQISAIGHGHTVVDYSMLEGSRTGKAAEADLILALGANAAISDRNRYINLAKNKISGDHGQITVQIDNMLSRLYA